MDRVEICLRRVEGFSLRVMLLGFSGIALIAAGAVLLVKARHLSDPWRTYRWFTPRPERPSGLAPLPDETWVHWRDPRAIAAEIAQIERKGRRASMLASRYSRVVPPELDAPVAPAPATTTAREPAVLFTAADDNPADGRPAQRGKAMGSAGRIPRCWRCGLHIVPGNECIREPGRWSESLAGPDNWAAGPVPIGTASTLEHRDCDPQALVDEFSDYIEELRMGDPSRREAIRKEILPTLERLDELVPPEANQP